jgi:exodeoxyribonuclease-3
LGTEKFDYKINWMKRLFERLSELRAARIPFLIGGDFNVIPEDKDCYDPALWKGDALYHPDTIQQFRKLKNLGLTDALRVFNQDAETYTFWDYQAGAWPRNKGIRIDHFLTSPTITDRLISCTIDKTPRGWDTPSDHTPIVLEIAK